MRIHAPRISGSLAVSSSVLTIDTLGSVSGSATSTGSFGRLHITNTNLDDALLITSTEDSSTASPVITLKRNSGSPADSDYIGQVKFKGENDNDQEVVYAKVTGKIQDASDGSEDGLIEFANKKAGSNVITARLRSDSFQLLNSTNFSVAGTSTMTGNVTLEGNVTSSAASTGSFGRTEIGGELSVDAMSIPVLSTMSSSVATRFDSRETDMALATASIAAITASVSTLKSNVGQELNTDSNVTFGTITSGDINSTGTITATEIHTTFVSSSIAVASGSNIFGDDTADSHQFTGSLNVSGSLFVKDGTLTVTDNVDFNGGLDVDGDITLVSANNKISDGTNNILERTAGGYITIGDSAWNEIRLNTTGTTDFVLDNSGNVGIGNASPETKVHITGLVDDPLTSGTTSYGTLTVETNGSQLAMGGYESSPFEFYLQASTASDLSSFRNLLLNPVGGKVGIGASSILGEIVGFNPLKLGIEGTSFTGGLYAIEHQNDISGGILAVGKSRGTSTGAVTIVQTNDIVGRLAFVAADGVDFRVIPAEIRTLVGASPGANDIPGHLEFRTNDGSSVDPITRIRITSTGDVGIGDTSPSTALTNFGSASKGLSIKNQQPTISFTDSDVTKRAHIGFDGGNENFIISSPESSGTINFQAGGFVNRMTITSGGTVLIGKTSDSFNSDGCLITSGSFIYLERSAGTTNSVLYLHRRNGDGNLIDFYESNSLEGSVSVSGNTVSYNGFSGTHDSSGIASDTETGTVLSTIDEEHKADHAKVKVSDSVGDKRVYGVLQQYVEETTNDDTEQTIPEHAVVASVGIGSVKVTGACQGGDLLESNGDGTAKVQDDDIIRNKTIGKVTIGDSDTSVKLVSCVLYCG